MKLLKKVAAFLRTVPARVARARKAAAPVAAAVIALVSSPVFGLDPDLAKEIASVCAALGIVVYAVPNRPTDPADHKAA